MQHGCRLGTLVYLRPSLKHHTLKFSQTIFLCLAKAGREKKLRKNEGECNYVGSMEAVRAERKLEEETEGEIAMESNALNMAKASQARCPQQPKGINVFA